MKLRDQSISTYNRHGVYLVQHNISFCYIEHKMEHSNIINIIQIAATCPKLQALLKAGNMCLKTTNWHNRYKFLTRCNRLPVFSWGKHEMMSTLLKIKRNHIFTWHNQSSGERTRTGQELVMIVIFSSKKEHHIGEVIHPSLESIIYNSPAIGLQ